MMKLYEDVKKKTHDKFEDMCDYDKEEPCLICGKPVKPTANVKMLRLIYTGRLFITDNEGAFEDDDDMGWYPVCDTCYKNFMKGS